MTHAHVFWANKLAVELRPVFWHLVNDWNFSGETAYCRVVSGDPEWRRIVRPA